MEGRLQTGKCLRAGLACQWLNTICPKQRGLASNIRWSCAPHFLQLRLMLRKQADTLTCALTHMEEFVPCGAAALVQLLVWCLAGMSRLSQAPP